ncbi:DNA-directed RNA polymerase sigma-70 factor [Azorhizobium oxalatiphilum]|uniref:DNA-directed RNA polymerase sigma-70 factor n=1 Tax=Azorhizobium oxalatiphilum TaxID=980631 RepID=A0A917BRU9_9HYPH|nr:sigma-70 family RNA polymerase sigma factor [Azorhizobium oxalatiphilum]GGF54085.1 DNA-directed RNA polymerase sigma-70 factor [Azorhizobium oxalatiphilum]
MSKPLDTAARLEDFERLYSAEQRRLERLAARRVGPAHAADVVQEVFAALWARTRGESSYSAAYLSGATKFAAISLHRAELRRSRLLETLTEEQYAAPIAPPDQVVAARQDLGRLLETLAALPARTRQVFLLNRMHQCTYDEIAEALGISYATVERDIARTLLALRATLEPDRGR